MWNETKKIKEKEKRLKRSRHHKTPTESRKKKVGLARPFSCGFFFFFFWVALDVVTPQKKMKERKIASSLIRVF